jgi:hypothetical protein
MPKRVPITERVLMQRISRKLEKQGQCLRRTRERQWTTLGDYHVIDRKRNYISEHHVDIERLGRKLHVLRKWEVLKGGE